MIKISESAIYAQKCVFERNWRDLELCRSDVILSRIQDGATNLGSISQWRKYRNELRAWPESEGFPNQDFRPPSPDTKK